MGRVLRSRDAFALQLSRHWPICPLEFFVPQRKHHMHGTRHSWACRYGGSVPDFDHCTSRGPPPSAPQHLCWDRRPRLGVGRGGALDPGPRAATLRQDIVPGHPQYPAFGRPGRLDLHEARCHAGHRPSRCADGWAFLYDPSGEVVCPRGVERVGWSPLNTASSWDAAVVTADAMVGASRMHGSRAGEHHWTERAGALLSTLLHAAARQHLTMGDVLRWIDRHDGAAALEILASDTGEDAPADQSARWDRGHRPQGAVRHLVHCVGCAGRVPHRGRPGVDPPAGARSRRVLRGSAHALRLLDGAAAAPIARLVVGTIGDVRDAAYVRARDGLGGPPTLLALDEVANIAPIPDLPAMVSEGAGQGLLVLARLQDLSQARVRWGQAADGFLSLFGTTVVLRGIAYTSTLRDISALTGDQDVAATTVSHSVDRWDACGCRSRSAPATGPAARRRRGAGSTRSRPRPRPAHGGGGGHPDPRARTLAVAGAGRSRPSDGTRRARGAGPLNQRPRPRSTSAGSPRRSRTARPRDAAPCERGRPGGWPATTTGPTSTPRRRAPRGSIGAPAVPVGSERPCGTGPQCMARRVERTGTQRVQQVVRRHDVRTTSERFGHADRSGGRRVLDQALQRGCLNALRRPGGEGDDHVTPPGAAVRSERDHAGVAVLVQQVRRRRRAPREPTRGPWSNRRRGPAASTPGRVRIGGPGLVGRSGGHPRHAAGPRRARAHVVHATANVGGPRGELTDQLGRHARDLEGASGRPLPPQAQ